MILITCDTRITSQDKFGRPLPAGNGGKPMRLLVTSTSWCREIPRIWRTLSRFDQDGDADGRIVRTAHVGNQVGNHVHLCARK